MDGIKSLFQRHPLLAGTAILGGIAVVVAGTVFALTSDSITSRDNNASTKAYAEPAPHLEMRFRGAAWAGDCSVPNQEWSDADRGAILPGVWDQDTSFDWAAGNRRVTSDYLCLRNSGNAPGKVTMTVADVTDREVGACTTEEALAEVRFDSCAAGDPGELSPWLTTWTDFNGEGAGAGAGSAPSCTSGSGGYLPIGSAGQSTISASLAPGEACAIVQYVEFAHPVGGSATEQQKVASQTDKVTWNVIFEITG
jgi:hypothetical protein